MTESETAAALRRASRRAGLHLLAAAMEGLKALEVFVDELARVGKEPPDGDEDSGSARQRIDIE